MTDVIHDVSVLTCNRPVLLERCLESLRASAARVRILDDGTDANPRHFCMTDRREFARRLAAAAGIDERLVTFALCGMRTAGPGIGAVRNTSLLLNAGRRHVQVDDDAICTPYVARDADEDRVELAREDSHVTLQWYGTGAAPLLDLQPARDAFLEAHHRILGRTLGDLRVRVTQNSLLGDCGVAGPWWKTLRTQSDADHYRSELLSREVLRKVNATVAGRVLAPTAFAMGIDGTQLVPPFLPAGRGEDALFVFLLNLIDEHACEAQLPAIVQHRPEPRPPFALSEILDSVTHLSVPTIFRLLFGTSMPRRGTLESIGTSVLALFRAGWKSAAEELVPRVIAHRRLTLERLQSVLDGPELLPDERRDDLLHQLNAVKASIRNASSRSLVEDIAGAQPELRDETTIVSFLRSFGELLQVWSDVWSAASAIELDEPAVSARRPARATPVLSVVIPYYRKIEELRQILPLNLPHLQRDDCEVILVLDEPSEEREVLELIAQAPGVRWRVIVNDRPHEWRTPSVSINVGLRHAEGTFVLVVSPESVFVDDILSYAIDVLKSFPGCVALGTVAFMDYDASAGLSLTEQIVNVVEDERTPRTMYGSIAARRADFLAVHGYDETITAWGGDDDNIRIRMEMAGRRLLACPELSLVHITLGQRPPRRRDPAEWRDRMRTILCPQTAVANLSGDWGREFSRVAHDWREHPSIEPAATNASAPEQFSVHHTAPIASGRLCPRCGRQVYLQMPIGSCGCRSEGLRPELDRFSVLASNGHSPRIACVMQLRDESVHLPGCLRHLQDSVDAVIALDDGSTDDTRLILQQSPLVADLLVNPPAENHVWDERENKRRLLVRAQELGFDWVLACDADERYEQQFLENLRRIAAAFPHGHLSCIAIRVRELWDSPTRYRVDGVWGDKAVVRFFALPDRISFAEDKRLHGRWPPDEVRRHSIPHGLNYNLYHCKTMLREERIRRRDFYRAADPEQRSQSMGYDYLAEEGPLLRTEEIAPARAYDLTTLPPVYALR